MEAESYNGPSLIIAYSHCIAHGINMTKGNEEQKKAVDCGHWINYRYDPGLAAQGKNPLKLDSKEPSIPVADYAFGEIRYRTLKQINPERAEMLIARADEHAKARYNYYKQLAAMDWSGNGGKETAEQG